MKVSEAMSSPAVSVPAGTPLGRAAQEMAAWGIGSVMVTEGGALRGIVTDRDLAVGALARGLDAAETVDTVMTSPVITVNADDDIHRAYRVFRTSGIRRLPVVDGPRVVGILTVDDMLMDVFQRLADLLGPVAWSVLEEPPGPPSTGTRGRGV
ncbi:CBS domain-containing protein [Streptomyces sp. JH34]|uniref:CBS domain-containing protein n=1 Tax=Streptomyces sp. JH34 TaxID=2793633 RepID=UPI0023F9FA84|nr:CBS domain-containing protein [Streptomyces sp. JH34]MDF6022918.1 CBS domain-containing protein [Streptomyces sp. JH34]